VLSSPRSLCCPGVRYVVPAFSCRVVPGGGHLDPLALVTLSDVAPGPCPFGSCQCGWVGRVGYLPCDSFIVVVVDGGCSSLGGGGRWQGSSTTGGGGFLAGGMVRKSGVGLELGGSWGERGMDPLTWHSEGLEVLWARNFTRGQFVR